MGVCLTVPSFGVGFGGGANDNLLAYLTYTKGLDVDTIGKLDKAIWALPQAGASSLLFIVGIVIGWLLLGIALVRSHAVPAFFGIALAFGGFTHPLMPTHVLAGIGLFVAAVGFAGPASRCGGCQTTSSQRDPRASESRRGAQHERRAALCCDLAVPDRSVGPLPWSRP